MTEQQAQIDVKHCATESYRGMKARQQQEVNSFPMAFAFSDTQFAEGMRRLGLDPSETEQIVAIGGDERLMHAFETACRQEAEWYDKHCGV